MATIVQLIDGHFFLHGFKVKPCPFVCKLHGRANCPFLHPGEKGRRDPGLYCPTPCLSYSVHGVCPEGDRCRFAHGFLEMMLHPARYGYMRDCESSEVVEHLKKEGQDHLPYADSAERAAIKTILNLGDGDIIICGYKAYDTQQLSFKNDTANDLAVSRAAGDAILKRYPGIERAIGTNIIAYGNASTSKKNVQPTFVPATGGYPGHCPQQGLVSTFKTESNKVSYNNATGNEVAMAHTAGAGIVKHHSGIKSATDNNFVNGDASTLKKNVYPTFFPGIDGYLDPFTTYNYDIGVVTSTEESVEVEQPRAQLLSAVDASPTPGGSGVPKNTNQGRVQRHHLILDSAASIHVTGFREMLQDYKVLAKLWSIAVADGYVRGVIGIGSIIQGESFIIPNVYHVEGLVRNLISASQLDRDHGLFSSFHNGICKILKRDGDVVGGGFLQPNGLYYLSFLQVPETGEEAVFSMQAI